LETFAIGVSTVVMLITAIALWFTISNFKKQLQLNFFADYTRRYQEINLNFPENINENDCKIENLEPEIKSKTLRYMRAYFDLCSEEYYLWKKGNIDNDTWEEWKSGIEFAFSKPAFTQAWENLGLDETYYKNFREFVANKISKKHNKTN